MYERKVGRKERGVRTHPVDGLRHGVIVSIVHSLWYSCVIVREVVRRSFFGRQKTSTMLMSKAQLQYQVQSQDKTRSKVKIKGTKGVTPFFGG